MIKFPLFLLIFLSVFLFPIPYPVSGGASFAYTLSPTLAHTEVVTIKITPSGFEPDSATLDQGSTVIFINQDDKPRWPASNVHPTHDLYSDFDPKKGIEPGKSWSFKAQKDGVWKFHDHLFPHMRGTLTVLQEQNQFIENGDKKPQSWLNNFLQDLYTRIKGLFEKKTEGLPVDKFVSLTPDKQTAALKQMADSDVSKLWPYLQQAFKGQSGTEGNIHDLAHLVGIITFEKKGFEGIKLCSTDFAFGCFHGFLDRAFKDDLSKLNDAHKACLQISGNTVTGPAASCIHGIGHGVASFYQTKDLKGALKTCQGLPSGNEYCFDGVFMEFVRSAPKDAFNRQDPLYPCNTLEEEFGETFSFSCGRNQVNVLSGRFGMSIKEVIQTCLDTTSTPFKQACFDSLGFIFAQSQSVEKIIGGCQQIGEVEYIARCLRAAAGELIFQDAPGWPQKSPVICSATSSVFQVSCFEHIDNLIREYGKDSSAFL